MRTDFVLDVLGRLCTTSNLKVATILFITAIGVRNAVSIRYSERLSEAGIESSVGSQDDRNDNAGGND